VTPQDINLVKLATAIAWPDDLPSKVDDAALLAWASAVIAKMRARMALLSTKPLPEIGSLWSCQGEAPCRIVNIKSDAHQRPRPPNGVAWFHDGSYASLDVLMNTDAWQHVTEADDRGCLS
jgi:hypothetical protein